MKWEWPKGALVLPSCSEKAIGVCPIVSKLPIGSSCSSGGNKDPFIGLPVSILRFLLYAHLPEAIPALSLRLHFLQLVLRFQNAKLAGCMEAWEEFVHDLVARRKAVANFIELNMQHSLRNMMNAWSEEAQHTSLLQGVRAILTTPHTMHAHPPRD